MWFLVLITILSNEPVVEEFYQYETMEECFSDREYMMDSDGYPHNGQQAVCIYYDAT